MNALPNWASCRRIGIAPLPFSRFSVIFDESRPPSRRGCPRARRSSSCPRGRRAAPGSRRCRCARPRRSSPSSDWTDRIAPASESLVSLPYFSSMRSRPTRPLPVVDLREDRVERVERGVEVVAELLALLAVGGDRAEEPLALLGAPEDVLERLGDRAEVRQQVAAALEQLLEPGARGRRDLAADRAPRARSALAALELDVLVAEQAARLDRGARALADHRRPAA